MTRKKRTHKQNISQAAAKVPAEDRDLPRWKTAVFTVIVPVLFFALLEGFLALVGIEPRAYDSDPYVGFSATAPLFVEHRLSDGKAMLRTAPNKLTLFNPTQFPAQKSAGSFRIFCTGGSTTYGRPYTDSTSFCGWLRQFLAALDPTRRWEVINAGGISYASYRVALLTEELIKYQPDLFVVYSGHNEFLEKRTYDSLISTPRAVHGVTAWLRKTRIFTALESSLESSLDRVSATLKDKEDKKGALLAEEVKPLLDSSVGPDAYSRDDELREQILDHYRFNLARAIDIAASVGARTILVAPASNLRNTSPFKSEHARGLSAANRSAIQAMLTSARESLDREQPEEALAFIDQALSLDDRYASTWFLRGRCLDALGRVDEAAIAYRRARDEDIVPLRALTPMSQIVRDVAGDRRVPLIDYVKLVADRSPGGIAGESMFLDHVHPTIEANRLLALALVDEMRQMGIVRFAVPSPGDAVERVTQQVMAGIDRRSHAEAMNNLSKVQAWAGQLDEAYASSLRAVELAPREIAVLYQAGITAQLTQHYEEAIGFYQRVIRMEPNAAVAWGNLGDVQDAAGRHSEAVESYGNAIRLTGDGNPEYAAILREKLAATQKAVSETPPDPGD